MLWLSAHHHWLLSTILAVLVTINCAEAAPTQNNKYLTKGYTQFASAPSTPDEDLHDLRDLSIPSRDGNIKPMPSPHRPASTSGQLQRQQPVSPQTAASSSMAIVVAEKDTGDAVDEQLDLERELEHIDSGDDVGDSIGIKQTKHQGGPIISPMAPAQRDNQKLRENKGNEDGKQAEDASDIEADVYEQDSVKETATKPFYGAARLAFGQNPEPAIVNISISTSTTLPSTTTIPSIAQQSNDETSERDDSNDEDEEGVDEKLDIEQVDESQKTKRLDSFKLHTFPVDRKMKNPEMLLMRHSGGQVSSLDMAQYVFWTGDEEGVARAVEEFIHRGLMTRENAIKLLREISMGIEYLKSSVADRVDATRDHADLNTENNEELSADPVKSNRLAHYQFISDATSSPKKLRSLRQMTTSTHTTPTISETDATPVNTISVPKETTESDVESYLKQKVLGKIDENNRIDTNMGHLDITDKVRLADSLYTAYTLEETIYQLAKVMFHQSLSTGSQQGSIALQKLTAFLELESVDGRVSPMLQKRILDVLLGAFSDCLNEHPDLIPAAREGLGNALDGMTKRYSATTHSLHENRGMTPF